MIGKKPDIEITKDGRVILRGAAYQKMRMKLCNLAGERCENDGCGKYTPLASGDAHHPNGRGGGKRDDRIFVEGKRNLYWHCRPCHSGKHIPEKVVPAKPTEAEFEELLGIL